MSLLKSLFRFAWLSSSGRECALSALNGQGIKPGMSCGRPRIACALRYSLPESADIAEFSLCLNNNKQRAHMLRRMDPAQDIKLMLAHTHTVGYKWRPSGQEYVFCMAKNERCLFAEEAKSEAKQTEQLGGPRGMLADHEYATAKDKAQRRKRLGGRYGVWLECGEGWCGKRTRK